MGNEVLIKKITDSFSMIYLTLISLIQACVLTFAVSAAFQAYESHNYFQTGLGIPRQEITFTSIVLFFQSIGVIAITWSEYVIGSTTLNWVPRFRDALIPLLLGISESLVVYNIFREPWGWFYSMSIFSITGYIAFVNSHENAKRKESGNEEYLKLLGYRTKWTEGFVFLSIVIYFLIGIFLKNGGEKYSFIASLFSSVLLGLMVVWRVKCRIELLGE